MKQRRVEKDAHIQGGKQKFVYSCEYEKVYSCIIIYYYIIYLSSLLLLFYSLTYNLSFR